MLMSYLLMSYLALTVTGEVNVRVSAAAEGLNEFPGPSSLGRAHVYQPTDKRCAPGCAPHELSGHPRHE
jgi:hypothetical protein